MPVFLILDDAMAIVFSDAPGRFERHLRRKHRNPLFHLPPREISTEALIEAGHRDEQERDAFMEEFRGLVEEAAALPPNADSARVLQLKERLDRAYETAAGLAGDLGPVQEAIRRLVATIMEAVRKGAGGDALAQRELDDEEQARAVHFELLQSPLVADLLHPETPIRPEELVATLLSEEEAAVTAALNLFDADQLALMVADARRLLQRVEAAGHRLPEARDRLLQMETWLARLAPDAR